MKILNFIKSLIKVKWNNEKTNMFWQRNNIIIAIFVFFLLLRVILFLVTQDVGIEHDSGWYIGAAQSLSENGKYASYLNSIPFTGLGSNPTIEGRYAVQDAEGLNYFPAGITVGPLYIIPQAILFKIFGTGYWQYRLWPLITYCLVLIVIFKIVARFGGTASVIMLAIFLWFRPQFFFNLSYEAFSEHTAFLFLLLSIVLVHDSKNRIEKYAMGGLFFAFACMTKFVFFMSIPVYLIFLVDDIKKYKISKMLFSKWLGFIIFFAAPFIVFEVYRFIYLYSHFGIDAFFAINNDILSVMDSGGGGLSNIKKLFSSQIPIYRSSIWLELGIGPVIGFTTFFVMLIWAARNVINDKKLYYVFFSASLLNIAWFILLAKNLWFRHVWYGMMLFVLLVISTFPLVLRKMHNSRNNIFVVSILFITYASVVLSNIYTYPIINKSIMNEEWRDWLDMRTLSQSQGPVFAPVTSWSNQIEASDFVKSKIRTTDFIVYHSFMNATELSVHTRRVHYPLSRMIYDKRMNKNNTYFIIGPYQKGFMNIFEPNHDLALMKYYCDKVLFNNPSYTICNIKPEFINLSQK